MALNTKNRRTASLLERAPCVFPSGSLTDGFTRGWMLGTYQPFSESPDSAVTLSVRINRGDSYQAQIERARTVNRYIQRSLSANVER